MATTTTFNGKKVHQGTIKSQKTRVGDGRLVIEQEGTVKKFLKHVQQVTFAGTHVKPDQRVLYVTERCVMELLNGKMTITEIAPGINLEKDVLAHMDFVPAVSPDLKVMDAGLFCEKWGSLRAHLDKK